MPTLRVYDTKGNEHSPTGEAGRTNETVKDLFYDGVRLAIETGRERKFTAFFRARETRNARTEQFYAVYTARDATIREFMDALRDRIESEWEYTIDDSADDMSVFRALDAGRTSTPGDDRERSIVEELIGSRQTATVGVRDAEHALGLISEFMGTYDRAAIADSPESSALSGFDLVVAPDGTRGIAPVGDTESRWESTKESLRSRHIDQEVASINESVQTLSREYNLSSSEIRSRVYQRVPALKSPNTGGSTADALGSSGGDDGLLTPAVGKAVAIGAIALIVLVAGAFGAIQLGLIGGGGDTVQGSVYADAEGNETVEGIEVTLETTESSSESEDETEGDPAENGDSGTDLNATTDEDGAFTIDDVPEGDYVLTVGGTDRVEYDERDLEVPSDDAGDLEIRPDRALISGEVVDAETGEPISTEGDGEVDADVELVDTSREDENVDAATGGSYEFAVEEFDGEYAINADADGYESGTLDLEDFGEQDDLELEQVTMSLSGQVTDSREGEGGIEAATVTVTTDAGQEFTAETNADGEYETDEEIPIGDHDVDIDADGFVAGSDTVEFEEENVEADFELDAEASVEGVIRDASEEETTLNGADVTISDSDGTEVDSVQSDPDDGSYSFEGLSPGEYTISVTDRTGYEDEEDVEILLDAGETLERDILLQPD
ncbi:hypothetical protein J2751_002858 [Halorubrum alkaliphilum]|uniref:Carboxypeptidase regulatory-like domain-containing protein n=1 Tax=Halorubrum alkaliphilum TaxID=261290 RepID=A0A8T4GI41_9EURY|nr:carboxypeptidase-like regulatory domain-containing protein [Halorubrum alkaliphilum]MBP1923813.1 hypothetical protein [Halorubrum alkaliphilum]